MPTQFKGPVGTIYLRRVPRMARDRFHAACVLRGKSMKKVILEFMEEYSKKHSAQIKTKVRSPRKK